ncbi:MAG: hypothetical protein ABW168_19485 [Sedimenticola sp.]
MKFYELQEKDCTSLSKCEITHIHDRQNALVETQVKVHQKTQRGCGREKYTLNLYHTTSRVMANGKNAGAFSADHKRMVQSILNNPELDSYDKQLHAEISSQLRNMGIQSPKKSKSKQAIHAIEQRKTDDMRQLLRTSGTELDNCPHCEEYVENGVACDRCSSWYHYGCEGLDPEEVSDTQSYHCKSCVNLNESLESLSEDILRTDEVDPIQASDDTNGRDKQGEYSPDQQSDTTPKTPKILLNTSIHGNFDETTVKKVALNDQVLIETNDIVEPVARRELVTYRDAQKPHTLGPSLNETRPKTINTTLVQSGNSSHKQSDTKFGAHTVTDCRLDDPQPSSIINKPKPKRKVVQKNDETEQLNLAKSLINNLERKVNDLENSNKILKTELNLRSDERTRCSTEIPGQTAGGPYPHTGSGTSSVCERDLLLLREKVQCLEMDSIRQRITVIESSILHSRGLQQYSPTYPGDAYFPSLPGQSQPQAPMGPHPVPMSNLYAPTMHSMYNQQMHSPYGPFLHNIHPSSMQHHSGYTPAHIHPGLANPAYNTFPHMHQGLANTIHPPPYIQPGHIHAPPAQAHMQPGLANTANFPPHLQPRHTNTGNIPTQAYLRTQYNANHLHGPPVFAKPPQNSARQIRPERHLPKERPYGERPTRDEGNAAPSGCKDPIYISDTEDDRNRTLNGNTPRNTPVTPMVNTEQPEARNSKQDVHSSTSQRNGPHTETDEPSSEQSGDRDGDQTQSFLCSGRASQLTWKTKM